MPKQPSHKERMSDGAAHGSKVAREEQQEASEVLGNQALTQLAGSHQAMQALTAAKLGAGNQTVQRLAQEGAPASSWITVQRGLTSLTTPSVTSSTTGSNVDPVLERAVAALKQISARERREQSRRLSQSENAAVLAISERDLYIAQQKPELVRKFVQKVIDSRPAVFGDLPAGWLSQAEIRVRMDEAIGDILERSNDPRVVVRMLNEI